METTTNTVRERPGCVLGVALGILVLGAAIAFLVLPRTEKRDGAKLLDTWLGVQQLPAGFEIRDAAKFMGGEEVVKLENALVPAESEPTRPPENKPSGPAGQEQRVDWSRLTLGAADQLPRSLLFVRYPEGRATGELGRLFAETLTPGRPEEIGNRGGRMVLEIGTLAWGDSNAAYVLERKFEFGGSFKDIARVNLSSAEKGLIVNAEWSRSEPFSKSRLESLLDAFRRR
ncbi:MAG: hypothetical protein ABIP42_05775 [Planctomycetota bacterium]